MKNLIKQFGVDITKNGARYRALFGLFLLVYFGEVMLSRMLDMLSSVERQFWIWWLLVNVFLLIPLRIVFCIFGFFVLTLVAVVILRPESNLSHDLSLWTVLTALGAFIAMSISSWRDK